MEKDGAGFTATHVKVVDAIMAGPSTSYRHCTPHFPQN